MRRRNLLGGMAAWPIAAHAQQPGGGRIPVVGFVGVASMQVDAQLLVPFRQGLTDLGYVPGRTLRLEERYSDGNIDRAQAQFAELAAIPVDVFLSPGPAATRTIARTTKIAVVA